MMVGLSQLKSTLLTNVADVRFVRRLPAAGKAPTRRMWCTNSSSLLTSFNGRNILNYHAPVYTPTFNPAAENIIITWDILMQNFRCISMDSCELIQSVPANDEFWKFFNENIYIMSTQQKINFMNT
jgi:hypothetical protein